jgi:uncharacterized cysteine cluster protein YcgN (CxxCxxCC family)
VIARDRIIERAADESQVVGECRRCGQCCVCWYYDKRDQDGTISPRKGWCPNLDLESRLCRIWDKRPEGCRNFPGLSDFEEGKVLPGCGFRLVTNGGE